MLRSVTVQRKTGQTHGESVADAVNELNQTAARYATTEGKKTFTVVAVIPTPGMPALMDVLVDEVRG